LRHLNLGGGGRRRRVFVAVVVLVLLAAGGAASAIALRTITLRPGRCVRVTHRTRICAARARTVTHTVTVAPSSIGKPFSGNGSQTLAPLKIPSPVYVHWTAKLDEYGYNFFSVSGDCSNPYNYVFFDNGNHATSGSSYVPAGTCKFQVAASGPWTLSF
jgi:hypothetical protein